MTTAPAAGERPAPSPGPGGRHRATASAADDRVPAGAVLSLEAWLAAVRRRRLARRLLLAWLVALGAAVALVGLWLLLGAPAALPVGPDLTLSPLLWTLGAAAVALSAAALLSWGLRPPARAVTWLAVRDRCLAEDARSALELSDVEAEAGVPAEAASEAQAQAQAEARTRARRETAAKTDAEDHSAPVLPAPVSAAQGRETRSIGSPRSGATRLFVRCHRRQVEQALGSHPPGVLVPFEPVASVARSVALLSVAVAAGLMLVSRGPERLLVQLGASAPVDTLPRVHEGPAATLRRVTMSPPRHTGLPERALDRLSGPLVVPPGTRITLEAEASEAIEAVRARLPGGRVVEGALLGEGRLRIRFVVRSEGMVALAVRTLEGWRVGAGLLQVQLRPDRPPEIEVRPAGTLRLPEPRPVRLRWTARDDYGVTEVRLVYRVKDGPAVRRRLGRGPRFGSRLRPRLTGTHEWDLRPLRLGPGGVVRFHLEVEDNRALAGARGGAQRGRSPTHEIRIVGKAEDRAALMAQVRQVLEASIQALADRLELPDPASEPPACRRQLTALRRLQPQERRLIQAVSGLLSAAQAQRDRLLPVLVETLTGPVARLRDRLRPVLAADRAALSRPVSPCPLRRRAAAGQRRLVPLLEELVLQLDALVARAILEQLRDLVARLDRLQRQVKRLAEQLRRRSDPAARRRLERKLAEIKRLMAQLGELAGSLGDEQLDEHVNRYALRRMARQRRQTGLDPERLAHRVKALKEAIAGGVDRFRQVLPLPGERARSELTGVLRELVRAQRQLTRRARQGADGPTLAPEQRRLARGARELSRRAAKKPFGAEEAKALRGAADKLHRAADALDQRRVDEAARVGREGLRALKKAAQMVQRSGRVTRQQARGPGATGDDDGRVEIPPAGGDLPRELRRSIQESGRTSWPPAFREALRRYYERLLR